jgi:hypothetical protein
MTEQQAARGGSVIARQIGQLLIEVLETQADPKRRLVFEEEFSGLRNLGG